MFHYSLWAVSKSPSTASQTLADVDVFEIHEPAIVNAARLLQRCSADQHRRPGETLHISLDFVAFGRITEWVKGRFGDQTVKSDRLESSSAEVRQAPRAHELNLTRRTDELWSHGSDPGI